MASFPTRFLPDYVTRRLRRLAGFNESLADTIDKQIRSVEPSRTETTMSGPGRRTDPYAAFRGSSGRRETIEMCREMYRKDPRARGIIQTIARDATKNGFEIQVDNPDAQTSADALIARLHLDKRLDDWFRLTLRDGDSFLEMGIDQNRQIVKVTRKPTVGMHRNSNAYDEFDDPQRAYWYSDHLWFSGTPGDDEAVWFRDWQIVHARWDHEEGDRYGSPLLASAEGPWKRMREGEIDLAVRRKTRSGVTRVHFVPGQDETALEKYRADNEPVLSDPLTAVADYFTTARRGEGGIEQLQGDAHLGELGDIMHHVRTFWLASPVPMSLLGYGQDLNRDVLEKQKEQYDESQDTLRTFVVDQLLMPIVELQWLLDGIYPDNLTYKVVWQKKQIVRPSDLLSVIQVAHGMRALGFPDDKIFVVLAQYIPGLDLEDMLDVAERNSESGATDAERLALLMRQAMAQLARPSEPEQADLIRGDVLQS